MKIYLINKSCIKISNKIQSIDFVSILNDADKYDFKQYNYINFALEYKTIYITWDENVYCLDMEGIPNKYLKYFYIWKISDNNIYTNILKYFSELSWIALHSLSVIWKTITINKNYIDSLKVIKTKNFIVSWYNKNSEILIKNDILSPSNLVVSDWLYKIYSTINERLEKNWKLWNVFFEDFILSLLPEKYWCSSLFFLNSRIKFKISNFFNEYDNSISLHIPVARHNYIKDLFESLLLQTNKNYKIFIWVDWYNKTHNEKIIKILNKYKSSFNDFNYFINKKNLWVWKTRWKLLNSDKKSRYIVFLDDDNFLSTNTIDFLYKNIEKYKNMWMYSISNIDVKFDVKYSDYIYKKWPFSQPPVYTNRERVKRLPLYCNQEETPLVHDRYFSNLLDVKYNKVFDNCSIDMVFNRFLEILCWNVNLQGAFQFMRIWHQYHQTREDWFDIKEFNYVMYILKIISHLNNNNYYYTYLIKTQIPKQNELFTKN